MAEDDKKFRLTWKVASDKDGVFVRRRNEGDNLDLDYIDVEWSHRDGFPEDYIVVPTTHPPNIQYQRRVLSPRKVIPDQVTVSQGTPDSVVVMLLNEKRKTLAQALGVAP